MSSQGKSSFDILQFNQVKKELLKYEIFIFTLGQESGLVIKQYNICFTVHMRLHEYVCVSVVNS